MKTAQVNDETGKPLTKVLSGETVEQARRRIRMEGILENSAGLALLDDDCITADGAPYMFKPLRQPPQNGTIVSCVVLLFLYSDIQIVLLRRGKLFPLS